MKGLGSLEGVDNRREYKGMCWLDHNTPTMHGEIRGRLVS